MSGLSKQTDRQRGVGAEPAGRLQGAAVPTEVYHQKSQVLTGALEKYSVEALRSSALAALLLLHGRPLKNQNKNDVKWKSGHKKKMADIFCMDEGAMATCFIAGILHEQSAEPKEMRAHQTR